MKYVLDLSDDAAGALSIALRNERDAQQACVAQMKKDGEAEPDIIDQQDYLADLNAAIGSLAAMVPA